MEPDFIYKIVAVGSGGVGKTSILRRFALNKFEKNYVMTLGVDFTTKEFVLSDGTAIKIVCVDTAGQEYYGRIRPSYYQGANGAFITFDLCNRNSYESLPRWVTELRQYLPDIPIAIVGNKLDLADEEGRRVSFDDAKEFGVSHNMEYYETSAKEGNGIDAVFSDLSESIYKISNNK
ncbi:MAG: Rab family GTPase [Candidatus Hodarchaeales archaeon]|jgi:small GTP-binding protein